MPDIVERVARALREWDWIGTPGFAWDNTHEPDRTHWLTMARAALAAMEGAHLQIGDCVKIVAEEWQDEPPHFITGIDWHPRHGITYTTSEVWPPRHHGNFVEGLTDEWRSEHLRKIGTLTQALKDQPHA